jgi:hypothetical protein
MALLRMDSIRRYARSAREIGPYAVLTLLLPGSTLIAGLIWTLRHRSWFVSDTRAINVRSTIAALSDQVGASSRTK